MYYDFKNKTRKPKIYPNPVNTSVQESTLATLFGKRVIRIEMIEVHVATSANPFKNLKRKKGNKCKTFKAFKELVFNYRLKKNQNSTQIKHKQ